MSIFNEIPKTDAVRLTEHANSIVYESKVMYESLKSQINQVFNMVWKSEFSPQSIIDELGEQGVADVYCVCAASKYFKIR